MKRLTTEKAVITKLTPDAARSLIDNNVKNRPLRQKRINQLAKAITENRWKINGASIVVDTKGRLLDGQHRCHAVIRANKPVYTVLVTGVKPDTFGTIDQGAKRTGADIFSLCGVTNPSIVASSLTIVYQHQNGIPPGTGSMVISMDERVALFDSLPKYEDIVKHVVRQRAALTNLVPLPMMSGLYYLFQKEDQNAAQRFLASFASADGDPSNPATALRRYLHSQVDSPYTISRQARAAYVKIAWNAFVAGEEVDGSPSLPNTLDIPINPVTSDRWL